MDSSNFVTTEAPALIGVGAQSIVEQAKQLGLTWTFQPATIVSVNATSALVTLIFDGDTAAITCINISPSNLNANDRVMGIITPTGNYVIGTLDGKLAPPSNLALQSFGVGLTTSSATFVNVASATGTFIKRANSTAIKVTSAITYYSLTTNMGVQFAVLINGTDYVISQLASANSSLNAHTSVAGVVEVAAGLGAGSYTVVTRVRATSVGGTINMDGGDQVLVYLEEVEA